MLPQVTGLLRVKPCHEFPGKCPGVHCTQLTHGPDIATPPFCQPYNQYSVGIQGDWLDWLFLLTAFFFHLQ